MAGAMAAPSLAKAVTDIDISSYYTASWADPSGGPGGSNSERFNGSQIAAAAKNGNTDTGIVFGDWNGSYVETGPDIGISARTLNLGSVSLPSNPSVNALINSFYGVSGQGNATITFTNNAGQTASYTLVGNQTIRDYNQNTFTNDLEGYNVNAAYSNVFTQNWWSNVGFPTNGQGDQRLDVVTFVLPSSWTGTVLVSMTILNPTPLTSGDTDDVALSALQVADALNYSPFFNGQVALSNGVYYLSFPSGNYFGYYSYLTDPHYVYHFDLGYEYVFDAADGHAGVYLYDFKSGHFFYTSPSFPFPYLYGFGLNTVLYYYPDPNNPGRYNTNGVRYFYNFATGQIITE